MDLKVVVWNIRGLSTSDKQKEVRNLIKNESLQLCSIIEIHVNYNKIQKVGEKVFGNWEFISNGEDSGTGCRIMVGWNQNKLRVWMIAKTKQIYASNTANERKRLWEDLGAQRSIVDNIPWVIMGDFNVTLKVSEHSNGSSNPSNETIEFQNCVADIEVEDILSSGLHFTWTKSLKNPNYRTLKKLDRVMINEKFLEKFCSAHGKFLPYIISDHSSDVLTIPDGMLNTRKAFRFSNCITDKKEFLPIVQEIWNEKIEGFNMYKVVKKMKSKLNQLSWKNGNVFDRVVQLRSKLEDIQRRMDNNPHNVEIKRKSCKILEEYNEACRDENSLLFQKAKVEWLKEGDMNTKFFHKIIKGRMHKGRVMSVCNEKGERFENEKVAEQFMNHFQEFLGKQEVVTEFPCDSFKFSEKLTAEKALEMVRPVSDAEIKNAMFDIEDSKSTQICLEYNWERYMQGCT